MSRWIWVFATKNWWKRQKSKILVHFQYQLYFLQKITSVSSLHKPLKNNSPFDFLYFCCFQPHLNYIHKDRLIWNTETVQFVLINDQYYGLLSEFVDSYQPQSRTPLMVKVQCIRANCKLQIEPTSGCRKVKFIEEEYWCRKVKKCGICCGKYFLRESERGKQSLLCRSGVKVGPIDDMQKPDHDGL